MNRFGQRSMIRLMAVFSQRLVLLSLAVCVTVLLFLVLPLMEQVAHKPREDLELREVSTANLPPPPPPPEEEPEPEEEEPPPPDLAEEAPPLDLAQLELALDPGFGDGPGGSFQVQLPGADGRKGIGDDADTVFSMADLDQAPRVVYQPAPEYPPELRKRKMQGTIYMMFIVDPSGRVKKPKVQKSTHPAFEQPALKAVRRWRFEPGKHKGAPVAFKMRIPISFIPG